MLSANSIPRIHILLLDLNLPDMPAVAFSLVARDLIARELVKRKNFASKNPGIIVVFAVLGSIALLLISLWIHKKISARRSKVNTGY